MNGRPILEVDPREAVRAPITYRVHVPGIVPFFEEHLTRSDCGYSLSEWEVLGPKGRAFEVALRRLKGYVELHQADAQAEHAKRKAKTRGAR